MKASFVLMIVVCFGGGLVAAIGQSTGVKPGKGNSRPDQYMINPDYKVSKPSETVKGSTSSSGHNLKQLKKPGTRGTEMGDGSVRFKSKPAPTSLGGGASDELKTNAGSGAPAGASGKHSQRNRVSSRVRK
jgi:hypothetical protein